MLQNTGPGEELTTITNLMSQQLLFPQTALQIPWERPLISANTKALTAKRFHGAQTLNGSILHFGGSTSAIGAHRALHDRWFAGKFLQQHSWHLFLVYSSIGSGTP